MKPEGANQHELKTDTLLPQVRRLEAVSFRSFPATSTYYDGTWAIRLTAGHPAKRLNSVNPLDPRDDAEIIKRLEVAKKRFDGFGRPFAVRQSPLTPPRLVDLMDAEGWDRFEESDVMVSDLMGIDLSGELDHLPIRDVGFWVDRYLECSEENAELRPGLVEVISAIQGDSGLFAIESEEGPLSAMRCVRDYNLAGIFDLVTAKRARRRGQARQLMGSALKWAKNRGADHGWLQVVSSNEAAIGLYRSFGFKTLYSYVYRRPPLKGDATPETKK